MVKYIVLVLVWCRFDMLYVCLMRLFKVVMDDVCVVVSFDCKGMFECCQVVELFLIVFVDIYFRVMNYYQFYGNFYNVFFGVVDVMKFEGDFIYVVEDDIMVLFGYFVYYEVVYEVVLDVFVVSVCKNQNFQGELFGVVYWYFFYQLLGVFFWFEVVWKVMKYGIFIYFGDMVVYCCWNFFGSQIFLGYVEQDGLFNRVCESEGGVIVYVVWLCVFYVGFYGYNWFG